MITSNDLFDLHYSLVLIRNDIHYELNSQILKKIEQVVLREFCENNSIRLELATIDSIDPQKWSFIFHKNLYTYTELVKDNKTLILIVEMCKALRQLIEARSFEQAYDLVDAIHYIPILVIKNQVLTVKAVKKILKSYTKKWGAVVWLKRHYI